MCDKVLISCLFICHFSSLWLQVKRRSCTNPSPRHGGAHCSGADFHMRNCTGGMCRKLGKLIECDAKSIPQKSERAVYETEREKRKSKAEGTAARRKRETIAVTLALAAERADDGHDKSLHVSHRNSCLAFPPASAVQVHLFSYSLSLSLSVSPLFLALTHTSH